MPLVELVNVTKSFTQGDETITPLDDVSLEIHEGEFVSLMGPSGTGKSTLLNLVSGIDRPDSGRIRIAGTEVTGLSRSRLADWRAAHLGYIFQTHNLIPVLTAYENVELPTLLLKLSSSQRRQRVELALEAVGLTDRADGRRVAGSPPMAGAPNVPRATHQPIAIVNLTRIVYSPLLEPANRRPCSLYPSATRDSRS